MTIDLASASSITSGEQQLKQQLSSNSAVYQDIVSMDTEALVNFNTTTYSFEADYSIYNPIGAFYESKSAGADPALSIANKTFRILNGSNQALPAKAGGSVLASCKETACDMA